MIKPGNYRIILDVNNNDDKLSKPTILHLIKIYEKLI